MAAVKLLPVCTPCAISQLSVRAAASTCIRRVVEASLGGSCRFSGLSWSSVLESESHVPDELCTISSRRLNKRVEFRAAVRAAPVDTQSSPFAAKAFSALRLAPGVLRRLGEEGLVVPTDVQVAAIPVILDGHDVAVQSYTGSGKTLAYLLPILTRVGPLKETQEDEGDGTSKRDVEVLIVVPSRELAMQIVREGEKILGVMHRKLIQQLIGGANPSRQEEALKKNKPLIVVGTPGRISELSKAGKLHTHGCRFLVLDEADQLLSSKFRDSMRRILEHVGQRKPSEAIDLQQGYQDFKTASVTGRSGTVEVGPSLSGKSMLRKLLRQTILVSATMPLAVLRAASAWGHKPLLVKATSIINTESPTASFHQTESLTNEGDGDLKGARESLPPNLEHFYVISPLQHRVDFLRKCMHALDAKSVIVFMNHSRRLKDTEFKLLARGISVGSLHGELGKLDRSNILSAFRKGTLRVLVVSEVGARGLDIASCDLVVNLELPTDGSHYAHRAGRTGRLGRQGTVISICEGSEEFVLKKFERQLAICITRRDVYEGKIVQWKKTELSGQKKIGAELLKTLKGFEVVPTR